MKAEKIIVLLLSFAVFAAGVWALYSPHGTARTVVLTASFALLTGIAVRQSVVRAKQAKPAEPAKQANAAKKEEKKRF